MGSSGSRYSYVVLVFIYRKGPCEHSRSRLQPKTRRSNAPFSEATAASTIPFGGLISTGELQDLAVYRLDPPCAALRVGYRVLFERLKYSRKNKLFWQSKFLSLAKKATFVQGANYILLCFVTVYWLYRYYVVVSYRSIGPLKFLCRMLLDDDEVTIIPNRKNRPPNYRRHISFFILITNYHIFQYLQRPACIPSTIVSS